MTLAGDIGIIAACCSDDTHGSCISIQSATVGGERMDAITCAGHLMGNSQEQLLRSPTAVTMAHNRPYGAGVLMYWPKGWVVRSRGDGMPGPTRTCVPIGGGERQRRHLWFANLGPCG